MRALVLRKMGELVLEERETPSPGEGEVLLRVVATGICGSDIHGYTGANGRRVPGQVMGHESVGTVAARGGHLASTSTSELPYRRVRETGRGRGSPAGRPPRLARSRAGPGAAPS